MGTIIASCIVSTGYGTDNYDEETGDCHHEVWASIEVVESNPEHWKNYDSDSSSALHRDFDLPMGFDYFRLTVDDQGQRESQPVERP